jgi:NarL family two-component system sensor histidine kinase LiaS
MQVTVVAVIAINLVVGGLVWALWFRAAPVPATLEAQANKVAAQIARPLQSAPRDTTAISRALGELTNNRGTTAVTDRQMRVLIASPEGTARVGSTLSNMSASVTGLARAALRDDAKARGAKLSRVEDDGSSVAVVPIIARGQAANNHRVLGLLFVKSAAPVGWREFSRTMLVIIFFSLIVVGLFAGVVGTGFGFWTARRLTRRLRVISDAADGWSRGEFHRLAVDESPDEIGQLARRLNLMARELQELVALRQNLASAEERNRLARDLHDTVKQQVFATAMQIGAARVLVERDVVAAQNRLIQAEQLARSAQVELTAILEKMRPGSYAVPTAAKNLQSTLHERLETWSRQNSIAVEADLERLALVSNATHQAISRIVQEALSNIARHSGATHVAIRVLETPRNGHDGSDESELVLSICDNGRGFDSGSVVAGMGLQNMRERAEALPSGKFRVRSASGQGTQLEIRWRDESASIY